MRTLTVSGILGVLAAVLLSLFAVSALLAPAELGDSILGVYSQR